MDVGDARGYLHKMFLLVMQYCRRKIYSFVCTIYTDCHSDRSKEVCVYNLTHGLACCFGVTMFAVGCDDVVVYSSLFSGLW